MTAINLRAELLAVPGFHRRTAETPEAQLGPAFGPTHAYRDGYVSTVKFDGVSAWERHIGDEIIIIVDGHGYLWVVEQSGHLRPQFLEAGLMVIIPAGTWHQVKSMDGISMITVSPQPTEHRAQLEA